MQNEIFSIADAIEFAEFSNPTLWDFKRLTSGKTQEEFTDELISHFKFSHSKHLKIDEHSSFANLGHIIYKISPELINEVEVFDTTYSSDDVTTFGVKIKLDAGTIEIEAHWTLWSASNTPFVFERMFTPLLNAGLKDKVTFNGAKLLMLEPKDAYYLMLDYAVQQNPEQMKMAPDDKLNESEVEMLSQMVHDTTNLFGTEDYDEKVRQIWCNVKITRKK
tara:strand:+ start:385 stop:1044 length:660 start_codon:yes stop_codon:yes gene_type:complete